MGEFVLDEEGSVKDFTRYESVEEAIAKLSDSKEHFNPGYSFYHSNVLSYIEKAGIEASEFHEFRGRVAEGLSKKHITDSLRKDEDIIQSIETLGDVHRVLNILFSRFTSLCSVHGLGSEIEGVDDFRIAHEKYIDSSIQGLHELAEEIERLIEYSELLETDISTRMSLLAPNITGLIGPILGARLLSEVKGLQNLARMPGSRIQIIGAQQAMFNYLKRKGTPPKHGIIFQHPIISKSPWWQRGKIARSLASKIAIAARIDAYGSEDRSEELWEDFKSRHDFIKKSFVSEPKKMRIIRTPKTKKKSHRRRR